MSQFLSRRQYKGRRLKAEINVVPYIDVMLVLLVIFMVTAPLSNPGLIDLPTVGKSNTPPNDYIQLQLKTNATALVGLVDGRQRQQEPAQSILATQKDLARQLSALHDLHPDLPLLIAADKELKYDRVVQAIAAAKQAGIMRVGLATKQ